MDSKEGKQKCKICDKKNSSEFISFGQMPVANAFLLKEDLNKKEFTYPMGVSFCPDCKMVQLTEIVPYEKYIVPDDKGIRNYAFFSSSSNDAMKKHFSEMAEEIENRFLDKNSKVLEIGSNDGIMLQAFKKNEVLGVEPSHNVARVAQEKGIETITEFFNTKLAEKISEEKGKYKTIANTNVFLNIIEIHDYLEGVYNLLDKKGVFITEDPYIQNILSQRAYDQIYDEHIWYFSLHSLENLLNMHDMEIFDAEKQWVHGGSMRVYSCKKGEHKPTERFKEYFGIEKINGIDQISPYIKFAEKVEESKNKLSSLLQEIKSYEKKIVGYGASSKGTIVCNYCNIGTEILNYIADSTPYKYGRFSPGKHIPIVSQEIFQKDNPDYALLFIPNHQEAVMKKEKDFLSRGGKFITHWPEPRII
jgi:methylation protein EvaC